MPKFSVLTPFNIWNELRKEQLVRSTNSVDFQSFKDFEHILVDDGSPTMIELPGLGGKRKILRQEHLERVNALRKAMEESIGDWFVFLDADDELFQHTLTMYSQVIEKYPDFKMFNFESVHISKDYHTRVRGAFKPAWLDDHHDIFGGGNIVHGTYIFHRSVYEDLGGLPPAHIENVDCTEINYGGVRKLSSSSPYDFSAYAQVQYPEIRPFFMTDEPKKVIKELGNPWGQDFYLFYKYTRKYQSKPFDLPSVLIHHDGKFDGDGHYVE